MSAATHLRRKAWPTAHIEMDVSPEEDLSQSFERCACRPLCEPQLNESAGVYKRTENRHA